MDDNNWLAIADAFHAAAIDGEGWYDALSSFAAATGSRHGQLVCMTGQGDSLNMLTDADPELPSAFQAAGGSDPRINPRRRAGLARAPLTILAEADFITPDGMRADAHYQEFAVPWDVPYICLTTLERRKNLQVGLAVVRDRRQGHIDAAGKRLFASIAPHVRAAVRTSLALGGQRAAVVTDAFERLSAAAFVCDAEGMVQRFTPQAEQLCSANALVLRRGRLGARHPDDDAALGAAIRAAAAREADTAPRAVTVRSPQTQGAAITLDVLPLPRRRLELRFDGHVLVLARIAGGDEQRRATLLRETFGLTPAEVEIAMALAHGTKAKDIAQARGVSVGTVRVQIKSLLAKAGVNRQMELLARLSRL